MGDDPLYLLVTAAPLCILVAVAGIAGVVALAVYSARKARERREAMARLAADLGLSFYPDHVAAAPRTGGFFSNLFTGQQIPGPYEAIAAFRHGDNRKAYDTLQGSLATPVGPCQTWAGDWSYETTSGTGKDQSTTTHRFSYLLVRVPFALSKVSVRPEGFLDRVAAGIGFDDIDFESAAFSRAYCVGGDDKRFVYDLIHPRMIEFLMSAPPVSFALDGVDDAGRGWLLVGPASGVWAVPRFAAEVEWARRFLDLWPRHLQERVMPPPLPVETRA